MKKTLLLHAEKGGCGSLYSLSTLSYLHRIQFLASSFGRKVMLIMKWSVFIIGMICYTSSALIAEEVKGQSLLESKVTIQLKEQTLKSALDQISKASGISFVYSGKLARSKATVSLTAEGIPLRKVLDDILKGLPFSYQSLGSEILFQYDPDQIKESNTLLEKEIKGKILTSNGLPIVGASIQIKGTHKGTFTDKEGAFTLTGVQEDDVLVISMIGFERKEIESSDVGGESLSISLKESIGEMEAFTVSTGYESIPEERATGSFEHVDNQLLNRQVSTDVIGRLKAIAPSILFDERDGETRLTIRGRSTIFGDDSPLIILDNFPYEGDLDNINPNDIESISVLKDAAAASIWGVRAGNGVIVITTKQGKNNLPPSLEFNSNLTIGEKPDLFYRPQMSSSDFIDVETFLFEKGYYDADLTNSETYPMITPVVEILEKGRQGEISPEEAVRSIDNLRDVDIRNDYLKHFYRPSTKQQYALNLKGGNENYRYFFSAGYDKNLLEEKGNDYERISLRSSQTFTPFKDFDITGSITYTRSMRNDNNTLNDARQNIEYPYAKLADSEGLPLSVLRDYRSSFIKNSLQEGFLNWSYYPLDEINLTSKKSSLENIRASTSVAWKITKHFKIKGQYLFENQGVVNETLRGQDSYYVRNLVNNFSEPTGDGVNRNLPLGDILYFSQNSILSHNGRFQGEYNYFEGDHFITALAGVEARQVDGAGYGNVYYGYDRQLGTSANIDHVGYYRLYPSGNYTNISDETTIQGTSDRFRSYFSNIAYTYKDRYTFSASGRIDQSNLFGVNSNQRSVPLWSVGSKWDVNKEGFYNLDWLSQLTLRATYGYSGNIDNSVTAYTTANFTTATYTFRQSAFIVNPPNPNLRWEKSGMLNLGLDFKALEGRIWGSFEYFKRNATDIIGQAPLNPTVGLLSYRGNVADMSGKGWDLVLNSTNINSRINWQTQFQLSHATDKVTNYEVKATTISNLFTDASISRAPVYVQPIEGRPLFGIYSYPWAGLNPETGAPQGYLNGKVSTDYSSIFLLENTPIEDLVYHGPAMPTLFGALRNTFEYRGWAFSFNIACRFGYYFRRSSINYSSLFQNRTGHKDYATRWKEPGDEMHTNVPSLIYPASTNRDLFYGRSEVLVEKGDHIRLQDINLSYHFKELPSRWKIQGAKIYIYANNLGLLWTANEHGIDPDFPQIPLPRTISFGINASF